MIERELELVLDGGLTRSEVEHILRVRAESDRQSLGNAYDAGGWNMLAVVFDHRHFFDVIGVRDARTRIAQQLNLGIGIAVRVPNDAGLRPERDPTRAMARAVPERATRVMEVVPAPRPDPIAQGDAFDVLIEHAVTERDQRKAAFEASPEGATLRAQCDQVEARMQGFAHEIIQRLGTQASRTRGCTECGSSIAVTHIKASPGEGGFTTIRCPVCEANPFCIFDTDLKRRDTIARQHQKAVRLYDEAFAAFGTDAPPRIAETIEADDEAEDEVLAAEPEPALEAMPSEPEVSEPFPALADPGHDTVPDTVWIIAGRVPARAEAA